MTTTTDLKRPRHTNEREETRIEEYNRNDQTKHMKRKLKTIISEGLISNRQKDKKGPKQKVERFDT